MVKKITSIIFLPNGDLDVQGTQNIPTATTDEEESQMYEDDEDAVMNEEIPQVFYNFNSS